MHVKTKGHMSLFCATPASEGAVVLVVSLLKTIRPRWGNKCKNADLAARQENLHLCLTSFKDPSIFCFGCCPALLHYSRSWDWFKLLHLWQLAHTLYLELRRSVERIHPSTKHTLLCINGIAMIQATLCRRLHKVAIASHRCLATSFY